MEVDWFFRIIVLIICLLFSSFFSGSEVALFSLDKKKLKDLKKDRKIIGNYIQFLADNPRRILVTILLGNTIANIAASITAVLIAIDISKITGISQEVALLIQIIILTVIILFIGEILPKLWANKFPLQFASMIAIPLYWISIIFYPIAKILSDLLKLFTSKLKTGKYKTALTDSEIKELADLGLEKGTIEEDEQELIQGIVSFKTITVREIMTPRVDINAIDVDTEFDELITIINESGHSRIPLYENNLDNIIGIIYVKDLLPYLKYSENQKVLSLRKIAREVMFIPETKLINDLLHEFQEKKLHLGIVVDEYGGTAGLVSLEDILEEIVGEIRDEFDREENEIIKINDTTFLTSGRISIDELNDLLQDDFSSENDDYDTIGGFILNHTGMIPKEGYHFIYNNYKFTVKEVTNKRINKVIVEKVFIPETDE